MPKISKEDLTRYFTSGGNMYPLYTDTVEKYLELKVHAEGIFPEKLLAKRRPSESLEIMQYRRDTYQPVTKLPVSKVISSFGKIRRSADWAIAYPEKLPAQVTQEESLAVYCSNNMPGFGNLENWTFSILLKQNLIDSNALIAVIPISVVKDNEYAKPVPLLFNSDHVIAFDEQNQYAVLKSRKKVNYLDINNNNTMGDRFYYIDDKEVIIFDQGPGGYVEIFRQVNTMGKMPVWKVRGDLLHQYDNMVLNQSRLHAMVPFLNKAAAGDSDLDGSKIQHLYPLFWYIQSEECTSCKGAGTIPAKTSGEKATKCDECKGKGKLVFTPFSHLAVSSADIGKQQMPVPPAGFVERDTKILELQEGIVEKNNLKALSAVNMQFLDQTPLSISGDAKQVDREELNNTVYTVAEDIVYSVEKVVYFINEWRYSFIVPNETARKEMLPNIATPENFDLLPEDYLVKEITDAKGGNINPLIIAQLQQQLAQKKFYNNPKLIENLSLYFDLDPLAGMSSDDKLTALTNEGITKQDYVISNYMPQFIRRALIDNKDFVAKSYDDKMVILAKYADEKITSIDKSAKLIQDRKQKVMNELKAQQSVAPAAAA